MKTLLIASLLAGTAHAAEPLASTRTDWYLSHCSGHFGVIVNTEGTFDSWEATTEINFCAGMLSAVLEYMRIIDGYPLDSVSTFQADAIVTAWLKAHPESIGNFGTAWALHEALAEKFPKARRK